MVFFGDFVVTSVLKSSCTSIYTAVLRAGAPRTHSKNPHYAEVLSFWNDFA